MNNWRNIKSCIQDVLKLQYIQWYLKMHSKLSVYMFYIWLNSCKIKENKTEENFSKWLIPPENFFPNYVRNQTI